MQLSIQSVNKTQRLILMLLLVRLLMGFGELILYPGSPILMAVAAFAYMIVTYALTVALIWREREHLVDFNIGRAAVILFITGKPPVLLAVVLGLTPFLGMNDVLPYLLLTPISIGLLLAMWKDLRFVLADKPDLPRALVLGLGAGGVLGMFTGFFTLLQSGPSGQLMSPLLVFLLPLIQLSNAATCEEPLFRGCSLGIPKPARLAHRRDLVIPGSWFLVNPYHVLRLLPNLVLGYCSTHGTGFGLNCMACPRYCTFHACSLPDRRTSATYNWRLVMNCTD